MLSSVVNQTPIPNWNIKPQWSLINNIASETKVQNILYYAIIAQEIKSAWKKDVEESYKQAAINDEKYTPVLNTILEMFEKKHIHTMVLGAFNYKKYYPKPQMRAMDNIELLIEKDKEKQAGEILKSIGFTYIEGDESKIKVFYRLAGNIRLELKIKQSFLSKKIKKYFSKPITIYKIKKDKVFLHEMDLVENYLFLLSSIAEDIVLKKVNMRKIIDLYCFLKYEEKFIDKTKLLKDLEAVKLLKFSEYIVNLLDFWFGNNNFPEDNDEYKALERYILTNGLQGEAFVSSILNIVIKEEKIKDSKKERKQVTEWFFPELEYMQGLYPILENKPYLLNLYRFNRFMRIVYKRIALAATSVKNFVKRTVRRSIRSIKKIGYNISDKLKKNNEDNT